MAKRAAAAVALSGAILAGSATGASAASYPGCQESNGSHTGVGYSIFWVYSSSKSYFVWNGAGYDHYHAYYVTEHYFFQPVDPAPHWTYKNCHGK